MHAVNNPFTVGLTGGIGSGKSTVTAHFATLGITIVDTDQIAHALTAANGSAIPAICQAFGDSVITAEGALDRTRMRQQVFRQPQLRRKLEQLLHPMIEHESQRQCCQGASPYQILAVPLLLETGTCRQLCHRICVVDCPPALQIARIKARNGLSDEEIQAIIATQLDREARLAAADDILHNHSDLATLQTQVACLHQRYLSFARHHQRTLSEHP